MMHGTESGCRLFDLPLKVHALTPRHSNHQWRQTLPTLKALDNSASKFQSRRRRKSESVDRDEDAEEVPLPWMEAHQGLEDELNRAINDYSIGYQKQSLWADLRDIKNSMPSFSPWLIALSSDHHRSSLCGS